MDREGEVVATGFAGDAEIGAGPAPLRTVGRNATATGAELREQMSQLVTQSAIDFCVTVRAEPAVKQNAGGMKFGPARRAPQTGRPFHSNFRGECGCIVPAE